MAATKNKVEIRSEAAVWAAGTLRTTDDLVREYNHYVADCEEKGIEPKNCSKFFLWNCEKKAIDQAADDLIATHIADTLSLAITQLSDAFDANIPNEQADYIPRIARSLASRFSKPQLEHLMDVLNESFCVIDGE